MTTKMLLTLSLLTLAVSVLAQNCENYGSINGSTCACPPGFGGESCERAGCGGTIFQGAQRSLAAPSAGGFSNLTASGCSCQSGWTGTGCNVCQNANACQTGLVSVSSNAGTPSTFDDGQNHTMTCNTTPMVWASSQMSCSVDNPTLKAIYPLSSTLNIVRTAQPSLSPLAATALQGNNTALASLFYEGVEQFYCQADTCVQSQPADSSTNDWNCKNLKCTCRPNTTFCGAVQVSNLTATINGLTGDLGISCSTTQVGTCAFQQRTIQAVFGAAGLSLSGCQFGECVAQYIVDNNGTAVSTRTDDDGRSELSGGVIAGLVVVGVLILVALIFLVWGFIKQRAARKLDPTRQMGGYGIDWNQVSYVIPTRKRDGTDKVILDELTGSIKPGQLVAILGPSGAGKTTFVEILAGKNKSGVISGTIGFPCTYTDDPNVSPRIGFVPQQDILPPLLTVYEALMFAANLRLPESVTPAEKEKRVEHLMDKLGITGIRNSRIGGEKRGISGGEMRRVSIGVELVAAPEILILDEPTSGLDSVSASKVANVLHSIAHDPDCPTAVIASIHQPSSHLYQTFDTLLVLSHGRSLYFGPGSFAPVNHFTELHNQGVPVPTYQQGYNVADYLLEVASDPPVGLFGSSHSLASSQLNNTPEKAGEGSNDNEKLKFRNPKPKRTSRIGQQSYASTFLTQFEVLSGREWKVLGRDYTLVGTHVGVACVLGVFCGGLYYQTGLSIAGFQSRVGCLFFLGALIAFSSLSALYHMVETRTLFLRERSSSYYSPTAWLLSRFVFDVIPLRVLPTIIVSTITYWMVGLASDAGHFFKFLFILVLYTLAMTLFNFLLGALFHNGGVAILLSALTALYQMTYAGFFVNLNSIPPVLRWLQWLCPLKYTLEALSVNEVGSGLQIVDTLEGVPVNVSAALIMNMLFGFGENNYYRDVLVLFAFIAGFGMAVVATVWLKVRERR